jgi:hypothetical protein
MNEPDPPPGGKNDIPDISAQKLVFRTANSQHGSTATHQQADAGVREDGTITADGRVGNEIDADMTDLTRSQTILGLKRTEPIDNQFDFSHSRPTKIP